MRILLMLPAPRRVSLTIGRMASWTQSRQEGWRLNILKRLHRPLTEEGSETPLPLTDLASPVALRS